jgi:hypothetical protein
MGNQSKTIKVDIGDNSLVIKSDGNVITEIDEFVSVISSVDESEVFDIVKANFRDMESKNCSVVYAPNNLKKLLDGIKFKNGSLRSLALNVETVFKIAGIDNHTKLAWDFAKNVKKYFGDKFETITSEDVSNRYKKSFYNKNFKRSVKNVKIPDMFNEIKFEDHIAIIKDDNISINAKIRLLLKIGYTRKAIRQALGINYQRVQNVRKNMIKKPKLDTESKDVLMVININDGVLIPEQQYTVDDTIKDDDGNITHYKIKELSWSKNNVFPISDFR